MFKWIKNFFDENQKILKVYNKSLEEIKKISKEIEKKWNKDENKIKEIVKKNINNFKKEFKWLDYKNKEDLQKINDIFSKNKENILANIYTITKYIPNWNYIPFDTQLLAILAIIENKLVEMKTWEWKSLVSFLAWYIKSLSWYTVNLISINEYLISRDAKDFKIFADYLDFEIWLITSNLNDEEKQKEYSKNIVYSTQDMIFDYLKDNMSVKPNKLMIKDYYFAIIDEIDVILIDLATTPIMLSIPADINFLDYIEYRVLADQLIDNQDYYKVDLEAKHVELSKEGVKKLEEMLNVENIYWSEYFKYIEWVQNALKSSIIFKKDEYYIVRDKKIIPIDHVTWRPFEWKMFPSWIQQSLETKEFWKPLTKETKVLANISYQNFFKLFADFSGLSGTLETEKEEFYNIFWKEVVVIPRLKEENVEEINDLMFKNKEDKINFLVDYVKEISKIWQPLLIWAPNSDIANLIYKAFKENWIKSNILTANHIEEEAKIIEKAWEKGAITIITNMSWRWTDIKITEEANKLGWLFVIWFERWEVRRVDNQLKGRVWRLWNNGKVLFLFSPEDKFIAASGKQEEMKNLISNYFKWKDNEPVQMNWMVISALLSLQKKIESTNTKWRWFTLWYDKSLSKHRSIYYDKRNKVLFEKDDNKLLNIILDLFEEYTRSTIKKEKDEYGWWIVRVYNVFLDKEEEIEENKIEEFINYFKNELKKYFSYLKEKKFKTKEEYIEFLRTIILNSYDLNWTKHLSKMSDLKSMLLFIWQIWRDPLVEYNHKAFWLFEEFLNNSQKDLFQSIRLSIQNDKYLKKIEDYREFLKTIFDENSWIDIMKPADKQKLRFFWKVIKDNNSFFDFINEAKQKEKTDTK